MLKIVVAYLKGTNVSDLFCDQVCYALQQNLACPVMTVVIFNELDTARCTTLAKKIETGTQAKHRRVHARQITRLCHVRAADLNFFGQGSSRLWQLLLVPSVSTHHHLLAELMVTLWSDKTILAENENVIITAKLTQQSWIVGSWLKIIADRAFESKLLIHSQLFCSGSAP